MLVRKVKIYNDQMNYPDAMLKYIGKQKDGESALADHGVRKYDNPLGQFTSPDPLWEKYYAWTPYHYCGNNPMMAVDGNGKFPMTWHMHVDQKLGYSNWGAFLYHLWYDAFLSGDPSTHFDNYNSLAEIQKNINDNGGWNKLNRHQKADFYCHTNYVEIWLSVNTDPNAVMPLYDEVDWNSDFGKALQNDLKSTVYPDDGSNRGHDLGASKDEGFQSKDKPPKPDKEGKIDPVQQKRYETAKDAAERSLKKDNEG